MKVVQKLDTNQLHLLLPLRNLHIRVNHNEAPPTCIRASHSRRHPTWRFSSFTWRYSSTSTTYRNLTWCWIGMTSDNWRPGEPLTHTHKHTHVSQQVALSPWKVSRVWGGEVWKRFLGATAATADQSVDVVMTAECLNFLEDNLLPEIIRKKKRKKRKKRRQRRKNKVEGEKNCNKTFYSSEMLKS